LTPDELDHCWVWVATPGQARRAVAAGVRHLQYCLSVSEAHNRANIGRDVATSLDGMPAAAEAARDVGGTIQLCLATAFTCPFEGPVPEDAVVSIVTDPRAQSADIVVCDTLGQAAPGQVSSLVTRVRAECPERRTVFHGHDTWGQGVANSLAAVAAGADMVDGSLAGLGGCPFAPGAGGNTSTEDLLFALRPGWLAPAALHSLIALGEGIAESLGEPNCSRTRQGARSTTTAFPWAMA
jgi:hydroxymethylglutaryl-CoA lyase